jgi:cupin fold WbuC family metalloprotein
MKNANIPKLSSNEIVNNFEKARLSSRNRHPKIIHEPGSEFNQVFNFMLEDSYMQPHLHPGIEKIEKMYLVRGSFAVIFFNDNGKVENVCVLEMGQCEYIEIPAFTWHTYVMLTEKVVVYETMDGKYCPDTWKKMAAWAPEENVPEGNHYLELLKEQSLRKAT